LWWPVAAVVVPMPVAAAARVVLEPAQDLVLPLELITPLPLAVEEREALEAALI